MGMDTGNLFRLLRRKPCDVPDAFFLELNEPRADLDRRLGALTGGDDRL
jgi:hypothetical protein